MKVYANARRFLIPALFALIFLAAAAQAQTSAFTYQGKLTDGAAAANGTYQMQFSLFDAVSGAQVGTTVTNNAVAVASGVFTVNLDFGQSPFTAGTGRFLEMAVKKPSDSVFTTLAPRQEITSSPYSIRTISAQSADSLSAACASCVTNANINSVDGAKITGTVANAANAANATNALTAATATNNVLKAGDTMTGPLILPENGLRVGTNQIVTADSSATTANVGIGGTPGIITPTGGTITYSTYEKLMVNGNIAIPGGNNYLYRSPKGGRLTIGPSDLVSANPAIYQGRIDDGFSSLNVNGLGSLWATGGTAGNVAYFIAPVHLPDQAFITGFQGQLIKNGGSLQSVIELYRTDSSVYLSNSAELIATASTVTSGGIVFTANASSVNNSFNLVNNTNYHYFIRYSGEQNAQNLRFLAARIIYQVSKVD